MFMRYMKGLLLGVTFLIVLLGCNGVSGDKPALPSVTAEGTEVEVVRASYCWDSSCVDTVGPPDILEGVTPTVVSPGAEIEIKFSKRPRPTSFSISRINEQGGIKETGKDGVPLYTPDRPGVYYYDLFAQWLSKDGKHSEGDSYYAFVIQVEEMGQDAVAQTTDETRQNEFIFRLVSEKAKYQVGEEVKLYGELEYIGDQAEVAISHSSSAITFPMEERTRGYPIGAMVNDIGLTTVLKKGEPYREEYGKSGGYSNDQDPEDYVSFIKDFLNREGFPPGVYAVNGAANFGLGTLEDLGEQQRVRIEANIEFEVVE